MTSFLEPKLRIYASILSVMCLVAVIHFTFFRYPGFLKTTATIVDVKQNSGAWNESATYTPIVEYTVDGKTYTGRLETSSSKYRVGKTVHVLYDPNDPLVVHDSNEAGYFFIVVYVVILVVMIASAIKEKQSHNRAKRPRER